MSDDERLTARVVPCEVDGDVMYAGGRILDRGPLLELWRGEPIYEWYPRPVAVEGNDDPRDA